ncbi:hypothetical protein [Actinoplanes sp. NPDC048796]|uniref:hypothetical protein n=1 Tax=unclassified Actinoplanes TaxID=2626549 RepID=UPI0034054FA8
MEERRSSRVGTVSGLALLAGGTAIAAASGGGTHSVFATFLLIVLTAGLTHSLAVEIKRQARRGFPARWSRSDTVNAVLLGLWAELALMMAIVQTGAEQYVGLGLAAAYGAACAFFVTQRRRAARNRPAQGPAMAAAAAPSSTPAPVTRMVHAAARLQTATSNHTAAASAPDRTPDGAPDRASTRASGRTPDRAGAAR